VNANTIAALATPMTSTRASAGRRSFVASRLPDERLARTEPADRLLSRLPTLSDAPTEPIEATEPTLPIEPNEPTLRIDSIEPVEPKESSESRDHSDHRLPWF
jgi:hypothetical protein